MTLEAFEVLEINGRDRLRVLSPAQASIDPESYRRLPALPLAHLGTVRFDSRLRLARAAARDKELLLPDQLRLSAESNVADLWRSVTILARPLRQQRQEVPFQAQEIFAILPCTDAAQAAVNFAAEASHFDSFAERSAAVMAAVQAFPQSAATTILRGQLLGEMQQGLRDFENGGLVARLNTAAELGALARRAFPSDRAVADLAASISQRRDALGAMLSGLQAEIDNHNWDRFLEKYPAFEPYQNSFPRMLENRTRAFAESARYYARIGRGEMSLQRYEQALAAFRLALQRVPGNAALERLAEDARISAARAPRATPPKADQLQAALAQARQHAAQQQLSRALAALDAFDALGPGPVEREPADKLRAEVTLRLRNLKTEARAALDRLLEDGRLVEAGRAAAAALEADPEDPAFLYASGALAALHNDRARALSLLEGFLQASNNLSADFRRRDLARRLMALLRQDATAAPARGPRRSWYSGHVLEPSAVYCPRSVAFQPPIESIRAGRTELTFQWTAEGRLSAIHTVSQEPAPSFFFQYQLGTPVLAQVGTAPSAAVPPIEFMKLQGERVPSAPDGWRGVLLPGDPRLNIAAAELLLGPVLTGVAGNAFFNPFVWDGLHTFRLSYDAAGRLESAREIGADNLVRFTWDGGRLLAVAGFSTQGGERQVYSRTLNYEGMRLVQEVVTFGGRTGRINYRYQGEALVEASMDDPGAHDARSRRIRFRP